MWKIRIGGGFTVTCGKKISVGSILDERYEIKKIIKKNENVIVYEGWHQQIEESFLIQEMSKNTDDTDKILSRARRLSDFSEFTNLFQVCDQFSTGENSYVIMEYPRGQCLEKVLLSEKKLSEKVLDHMFHSLLKTLEKLEEAGIKDIPVKADTLYLQEDGSLYLFPETDRVIPGYTDYAYQICELMYQGLTGQKPPDKAIRLLFDEMTPLVELNISGDAEFCKIIDEGLKIGEEMPVGDSLGELGRSLEQWREQESKKEKKKRYWIAGGILSAVLIGVILTGVYLKFEEKIRFWGIRTETVLLEPGKEMNKKEYQNALKITEDRIRELVDSNKYLVKDDDGTIRIILPEKSCEKLGTEELLKEYFSRPMKLSVGVGNSANVMFSKMSSEQYLTLDNEDIEEIEEVDCDAAKSDSSDEKISKMLKVTVSDEAASQMKEKLGSIQEQINEKTENESEKYVTFVCLDGEEKDYTFSIETAVEKNDWHELTFLENAYFKIAKNTWKKDTFDKVFDMKKEIGDIQWEKRTTSILKGWVDPSQIADPSVILEYGRRDSSYSDNRSDKGDYYHNIGDLAQRLETLGISYALGNVKEDYDRLVVKVRQKDMSDMVSNILGCQDQITIESIGGDSLYTSQIELSTEKISKEEKGWKVTLECDKSKMEEFAESVMESNGYLYLYGPLKYCVGKSKITEVPKGEKTETDSVDPDKRKYVLIFTETNLGNTGYFTKGMDTLADLFTNMADIYNLNTNFKLTATQYNEKGKIVSDKCEFREAWEVNNREFKRIQKAGQHADDYAEFEEIEDSYYLGEKNLYITLYMDTEEDYTDAAVERIKKIWKECKLKDSDYSFIRFYIGEKEEYPFVNFVRKYYKWSLMVKWAYDPYGAKMKEKMYQELKDKTFLKNGSTEEEMLNEMIGSLEETDETYEKMKGDQ